MWLDKAATLAEKTIGRISRIFGVVAVGTLIAMMMLTVADIVLRYVFNRPIPASLEFTEYLMLGVVFLALAWCALKGMHVKVDILVSRFSPRVHAVFSGINSLVVLAVCVLLVSQNYSESIVARQYHSASDVTGIPWYPFYLVVAFGFVLLFLTMLISLAKDVTRVVKG